MMLFSVIVPYYKNLHIIHRSIDSIINQTYTEFEALIVDDGSNDEIEEFIASYHDNRLHVLHKKNGGV